ncbi:hypothetical protein ACFL14_00760 [Patescibacteria group bacterium]
MTRVITPFGFGKADLDTEGYCIPVELDVPFLGDKTPSLDKGQVFLYSSWAVARVLNITGEGWFSNLQFYISLEEAEKQLTNPAPPDETRFCLDLIEGTFQTNQGLGLIAGEAMLIQPWVDRWAREQTCPIEDLGRAMSVFDYQALCIDAVAGGILSQILLDLQNSKILILRILVPPPLEQIVNLKLSSDATSMVQLKIPENQQLALEGEGEDNTPQ